VNLTRPPGQDLPPDVRAAIETAITAIRWLAVLTLLCTLAAVAAILAAHALT